MSDSKSACESTSGLVCGIEAPLKKMGNIQNASIIISSEIIGKENRFNSEAIKPCSRIQVQSASISIALLCSKTKNMALALQSKEHVSEPTEAYIQEYTLCGPEALEKDNLFVFEKSGVDLTSVIVRVLDISNGVLATLVLGTDYSLTPHGIELFQNIVIAGATYLRVSYDFDDTGLDEFNFLSEFMGPKYLYFKGTNYGDGDEEPLGVEIYKVLFSPVSQLDLISQGNYFLLNLTGQIEKDFENQDLGFGGYFKLRRG